MKTETIWLIEDHSLLRETLCEVLTLSGEESVVTFGSCEAAFEAMRENGEPPGIIVLDIGLPGISGVEGIQYFKRAVPEAEILMFTVFDDRSHIFDAIAAGASGYLLKSEPPERIVEAIGEIRRGGAPMTPEIARCVLDRFSRLTPAKTDVELSERERQVLAFLTDGLTKKEIAAQLDLSLHTIDNYVRRIYGKLHVNTLGGAVAKALREGLV